MTTPLIPVGEDEPGGDGHSRLLAVIALVLAVLGFLASGAAMAPSLGVPFVIIGAVLLVAALAVAIVSLVLPTQSGTGVGIAALVVAVLGGILCAISLVVSLIFLQLPTDASAASAATTSPRATASPAPSASVPDDDGAVGTEPSATPPKDEAAPPSSDDATDDSGSAGKDAADPDDDDPSQTHADDAAENPPGYDESAYVAEVRPEVRRILKEIRPDASVQTIDQAYSDDMLVSFGQSVLTAEQGGGDAAVDQQVEGLVDSGNGMFDADQARRFVDAVLAAAQSHLQR